MNIPQKTIALTAAYVLTMGSWSILGESTFMNRRIGTQEQLEQIIQEEADSLGIDSEIKSEMMDKTMANTTLYSNNTFLIKLGGMSLTRQSVKHELYHIKKGDRGKGLKYYLIEEPRATLYSTMGWKL